MANEIRQKVKKHAKRQVESQANFQVGEEAFYDYHRKRGQVYRINFFRGMFFGFGTILGGTLLVALLIWFLSQFIGIPVVGDAVRQIIETIQNK